MSIRSYLLSLLLSLCVFNNVSPNCVFNNGKYDLSTLDRPSGWPVPRPSTNGTSASHYEISICRPLNYSSQKDSLQKGCPQSSICLVSEDSAISYGNAIENKSDYAIAANIGTGFSLYVLANTLCKTSNGKYRAFINFICGPHLGAPELVTGAECQVHFIWRTSAACPVKKTNQVPCYVLDEEGNKRDLSPLIKSSGGYSVYTPNPAVDFFINVCSNLHFEGSDDKCPKNTSACRVAGNETYSFGSVSEGLKYTPEALVLTYKSSDSSTSPPYCRLKPKTTVFFKCPVRGYSQPPKLISDLNCQYEVEWETEYACPENLLKGNLKTCQFTRDSHGVEIDLSPLRSKSAYNVTGSDPSTYFTLNVCSGLGNTTQCGGKSWKSTAVCLFNSTGKSHVVGSTISSQLLYADGEITLKYLKGESCNGTEQTTVIHFVCDPNAANDGAGEPHHVSSESCSHVFEWRTKYACLKHPLDTPCSVTFDKKTINLQKLLLLEGEPWEAIDSRAIDSAPRAEYFINVCGQVSNLGNFGKCGEGSSVCVLTEKGDYLNLGNFTLPPVYDRVSESVRLHYSGGSLCHNKTNKSWQSTINFICKPGQISSKPILVKIDESECSYEFEWHTADACPTGLIEGADCKVFDESLGIKYDLTPLKGKVYNISSFNYDFYLGVCEPVKNSPCSSGEHQSENVGVCQVDKTNKATWKTGEPSSHISYMDGVVNLTYRSGDPYYDQNRTARVTIIIFICDYDAGNGSPRFIEVEDFAFVFHWYTALVCPQPVLAECMVRDPYLHIPYDLSGLSVARKNWMTVVNEDNKERQIYLNVCRSLIVPVTGCDPNAAACLTERKENGEEIAVIPNLGRAVSPPTFHSPGHITLRYTNGDPCVSFGENTTYSTFIHFLCVEEDLFQTGFRFLSKVGSCEYSFLWATKAACPSPLGKLQVNSCQLTDPDSGFTFDLTSLHKSKGAYSVRSPAGGSFQFNICGKVTDACPSDGDKQSKNVSMCELDMKGELVSNIAVSDSYVLSYSAGSDLTLTYKSGSSDSNQEVVIKFPCYNSTSASEPKFLHHGDGQYIFELKTPLTCIPEPFDCNVVDEYGQEYDFTPLARYSGGNWEVSDFRPEYSHVKYHINFCRPLNKVTNYKCPGGASASCMTDINDPDSVGHDLGTQLVEPMIGLKGAVVIHYSEGSICNSEGLRRSTTISLFCSSKEGELEFLGQTPECEYVFSIDTPVACPLRTNLGKDCLVKEPVFGYTFNLNPLKKKNSNYNVTVGDYSYVFNVCDKLSGFNNKCENSSACQLKPKDPSFSKSLGLPSDQLAYRKGIISLEYKSGSGNCHGQYNRTTKITFTCHHALEDKDGPVFIAEAQDCTYLFEWPTVHACPPFDVIECSAYDKKGVYYDLSRLSIPSDNYYVKHPYNNKTFVINVCRSVVHTADSVCPYTSAACLIDSSSQFEPVNLGVASHGPYFDGDKLKINYTSGDPCDDEDAHSARFMQTVIEFTCNPSLLDGEPEFIGRDGCTYYFDWHTAYACPPKPIESDGNCTVKDPVTGHLFNLTSLRDHGPFKYKIGNHQYHINVCGSNYASPCQNASVGMCQEELDNQKRHWVGGKLNSNLVYNDGLLFLSYTGGDYCHNKQFQRNTVIKFQCGQGINEPQFLFESNDCSYFFNWKTELACQTLRHCAIKNGSLYYDLTTLAESHHTAATTVPNDNASYYISVCNSLEETAGVYCPPGAAVCRVTRDPVTSRTVAESLGKVEYPPFIDFMGHATVIYTNGSTCQKNSTHKNRARIIFMCEPDAGVGEPVLIDYTDECFFLFEWRTNVVCPEKPEVPSSFTACNYTDNSRGIHFNLLPLQKTGENPYYEVSEGANMTFKLNICSNVTQCGKAGVCGQAGSVVYNYGIATSQKFTYRGGRLRLTFYDGDDCPSGMNGKRTSEIFFVCDPAAGLGKPILHKKYTCLAVFKWETSLVCMNIQRQCAFDVEGHHYDFNLLSSLSHNWISSDSNRNTYWINICRGIQPTDDTLGCSPTSAVCMMTKNGYHMSLGMVQSMQVKSINSTDLLLTFDNGDPRACSILNSASPLTPVTRLFMRCGRSLGEPHMFSGPDSQCYYDFVWETSLACADGGEDVMVEKDGIIKDNRLEFSFDINDILNRTFIIPGNSTNDHYVHKINLSGGVASNSSDPNSSCHKAAVCQTKPGTFFERDIGSFETRKFVVRGSELHLILKSLTRPCGKNLSKQVTTLINMQCSSASGYGFPQFIYESGNCDYIFEWSTIVICPNYHRKNQTSDSNDSSNGPKTDAHQDVQSSHKAEIAVGVIFGIIAVMIIAFIVIKAERRAIISSRFRSLFGTVNLPYFRYKRCDGEKLVLVDASQTIYDDEEMLRC